MTFKNENIPSVGECYLLGVSNKLGAQKPLLALPPIGQTALCPKADSLTIEFNGEPELLKAQEPFSIKQDHRQGFSVPLPVLELAP